MKGIGELVELILGKAGRKNLSTPRKNPDDGPETPAGVVFRELVEAIGSEVLGIGQWLVSQMKRTTGEGAPENGLRFGQAYKQFNAVDDTLQVAVPNESWGGSGSHAYADQNTRQQVRSETMADADREVLKVLSREAFQINYHRDKLEGQYNFLGELSKYTFALQFIPRYGEAAKIAIELAAVQSALSASSVELYQLHSEVNQNAAELQQTVGRYSGVAHTAELSGADFGGPPPPPPGSPPLHPIERSRRKHTSPTVPSSPPSRPTPPTDGAPLLSALPAPPVPSVGGTSGAGGEASGAEPSDQAPPAMPDLLSMPSVPENPPAGFAAGPGSGGGSPLGSLMSPLGGLPSGAPQAAGQRAVSSGGPAAVDKDANAKAAKGEDEQKNDEEKDKHAKNDKDAATPGEGGSEPAPVHIEVDVDPDRLQGPVTVTLDPDNPRGPSAAATLRN